MRALGLGRRARRIYDVEGDRGEELGKRLDFCWVGFEAGGEEGGGVRRRDYYVYRRSGTTTRCFLYIYTAIEERNQRMVVAIVRLDDHGE